MTDHNEPMATIKRPSFGFIMIGGALVGSAIRDLRIANELAERGHPVHVFWTIDRTPVMQLHPDIKQHWMFNAGRYNGFMMKLLGMKRGYFAADDYLGRFLSGITPLKFRLWLYQNGIGSFDIVRWALNGLIRHVCRGVERDAGMLKGFAKIIERERITHLIPNLSVFGPFCDEVKQYLDSPPSYLVTFQGYEVYGNYARDLGIGDQLCRRLKETAERSDYPAVVVSQDYGERVQRDIGLRRDQLEIVPACITLPARTELSTARRMMAELYGEKYNPSLPLLTYMGRQDSEKGIDLLIYAAKMLSERGLDFQLAISGTTAWGHSYKEACYQIAENLRLPILKADYLEVEQMSALYRASRAIVYPSIHREPFGMVPVEAMAQGTPVIVPNAGGVSQLPFQDGRQAGLTFKMWDTADLSLQIGRLLTEDALHAEFSRHARIIAEQYSVSNVCDRMLELVGLSGQMRSRDASGPLEEIPEPRYEKARVAV
jgi:glycosyltransferase involved in cell wall biosynthesis